MTAAKTGKRWLETVDRIYHEHATKVYEGLSGSVVSVAKKVNVSGFDIEVPDEAATKALRAKIAKEGENEQKLRNGLAKAGIKPLAILPEDIFDKLAAKAGFYTFYKIKDGMTYGNGPAANSHYNWRNHGSKKWEGITIAAVSMILGFLAFIKLGHLLHFDIGPAGKTRVVIGVIALLVAAICSWTDEVEFFWIGLVGAVATYVAPPAILIAIGPFLYLELVRSKSIRKKGLREVLWPERNDIHGVTDDMFRVILPEPPQHVKNVLAKCHVAGIETFTTVHPNAFTVVFDKQQIARLWSKYDPIICTKENGMVAVLEQFGDFPEEKEVVGYIQQHFESFRQGMFKTESLN